MRLAGDANKPMKLLKIFRRRGAWPEQLTLRIEVERESDGRWIVDVVDPGESRCDLGIFGRDGRIRTGDPLTPSQVRYPGCATSRCGRQD